MQELLEEVKALQGVMGSLVYKKDCGIICSNFPSILQNKASGKFKRLLNIFSESMDTLQLTIQDIEIRYNGGLLIIRPVYTGSFIIIFSEPSINIALLNMTLKMLGNEFTLGIEKLLNSPELLQKSMQPEAGMAQKITYKQLMNESANASVLQQIKKKLAAHIGPIGEMIMRESVEKWARKGDPSQERLHELVDMLCADVNDKKIEAELKEEVKGLIALTPGAPRGGTAATPDSPRGGTIASHDDLTPLKPVLSVFQNAFAMAIGPTSVMLLPRIVEKWIKKGGAPAKERLADLVDMICEEIGDSKLEKEFRNSVKKAF